MATSSQSLPFSGPGGASIDPATAGDLEAHISASPGAIDYVTNQVKCVGSNVVVEAGAATATVTGADLVAVGAGAGPYSCVRTVVIGSGALGDDDSVVIGDAAAVTATFATALGRAAQAGDTGTAVGYTAHALGARSIALGADAQTAVDDTLVIGYQYLEGVMAGSKSLKPYADLGADLGAGAKRWGQGFVDKVVARQLDDSGAGFVVVNTSFRPDAAGTRALGSAALYFTDSYADTSHAVSMVPRTGATVSFSASVLPEAAGTRTLGSAALYFSDSYADISHATSIVPRTGTSLTVTGSVLPEAAGTRSIGSAAAYYSDSYADTSHALTVTPRTGTSLTVTGTILPEATGTRALGSATRVYSEAHVTNAYVTALWSGGTITVVNSELSPNIPNFANLGNGVFYWQGAWAATGHFNTLASIAGTGIAASERISPSADNTLDLGQSAVRWRDLYAARAHITTRCGEMGRFYITGTGVAVSGLVRVQLTATTFNALADFNTVSGTTSLDGRILAGVTSNRVWFQNQSAAAMYALATVFADYTPGTSGADKWYLTVASTENAAYSGSDQSLLAYSQKGTTNELSRMILSGAIYWPAGWYAQLWVEPVSVTNTSTHQYAPNLWASFSVA